MKVDVLAIGAHPDDVELGCGATIAKLIKQGISVAIIDLTKGELGSRGDEFTRSTEANEAAKILGVSRREQLGLPDGFFDSTKENILLLVQWIRFFCPEIVLCNTQSDRHPDHGKAYRLVKDACFLSGLSKIETFFEGEKQQAWRPKQIYRYIQWNIEIPDVVVDVTGFEEIKIQACAAYKTQFYDSSSSLPQTPISSLNFWESVRYRMRDLGRIIGTEYAEGFTAERIIAVKNLLDLI